MPRGLTHQPLSHAVLGAQGQPVAIKKIADVFHSRSLNDSKRILRELILLRHLGGHSNITWIQDIMVYVTHRVLDTLAPATACTRGLA